MPVDGNAASSGNGTNVASLADSRDQVDRFYAAALTAVASHEDAPGLRIEVHPHLDGAYVIDPHGHMLMVVCHRTDSYHGASDQPVRLVGSSKFFREIREYVIEGRPSRMAFFIHEIQCED